MSKLFFFLLFCVLSLQSFAQTEADFLKNKLYIVETNSPKFDSALKEVMIKVWNLSAFGGQVSRKALKEMAKSKENSFIDPTTYTWHYTERINGQRSATGLFLYQGKPKGYHLQDALKVIYFGGYVPDSYDSSIFKLELMIRSVMTEFTSVNPLSAAEKKYNLTLLKKKKILLINTKYINPKKKLESIEKDAFDDYPYKKEFASSAQIEAYIRGKDPRYALAIPVVNDATKQVGIYDLETALYLGGFERKGILALPIRAKDVESLIDKINGMID